MDKFTKFKPFIYISFGILLYTLVNHVGAIAQFLEKIFGTIAIFVYGMVISVFLNPVLDYLEKHSKLNRIKSILVIYIILLLIVSLLLFLRVATFLNNIRNLIKEIPTTNKTKVIIINPIYANRNIRIDYTTYLTFKNDISRFLTKEEIYYLELLGNKDELIGSYEIE